MIGMSMETNLIAPIGAFAQQQSRAGLEYKLQQLQDIAPLWHSTLGPAFHQHLSHCLNNGNFADAEAMIDHALALMNSSRHCLSCQD